MIYLLKKDLAAKKVGRFSEYLYSHCDVATFNIPYFSWKAGKPKPDHFNAEFTEYLEENIDDLLDDIKPFIIGDCFSNVYYGSERSYMMRIITVALDDPSDIILPWDSVYGDEYPKSFEDLCLFSKGKCFMKTVTHENLCWFYPSSYFDLMCLKKLGLKLSLVSHDDTDFTLDYRIHLNERYESD